MTCWLYGGTFVTAMKLFEGLHRSCHSGVQIQIRELRTRGVQCLQCFKLLTSEVNTREEELSRLQQNYSFAK